MYCIYCGKEENEIDKKGNKMSFSQEHIIPSSLIGGIENNPLTISCVHSICNNILGMFVDSIAFKNWFVYSTIVAKTRELINIKDSKILPITYMGTIDLTHEDRICDLWLGPTGDQIYHFHKPYPDDNLPSIVGIHPAIKYQKLDHGFAFLFITASNPDWHETILKSFIYAFRKSVCYLGNGNTVPGGAFSDIPKELEDLRQILFNKGSEIQSPTFKYSLGEETRFLAKVALGMGAKLFGQEFILSDDASLLRSYMWEGNFKKRSEIPIHGTGLSLKQEENMFTFPGSHVINIMPVGKDIALTFSLFDFSYGTIRLGELKESFKSILGNGLTYVISPSLKKVVGPIETMRFFIHKYKMKGQLNSELQEIEDYISELKPNPPFKIEY